MFLTVIHQHAARVQIRTVFQGGKNHYGPLKLVFQMGSVNQHKLVEAHRQIQMLFKNSHFMGSIPVQPYFPDAEDIGPVNELRNQFHHIPRESHVLRLLGIDAQPCVMVHAELGRPGGFAFRKLYEIIPETVRGRTVVTGPERRFPYRQAAGLRHGPVFVRGAAHHMYMRFYESHHSYLLRFGAPQAALAAAVSGTVLSL